MKASDFLPFYGVEVLLQFKETIALAEATGEPRLVPRFTADGKMANAEGKAAASEADIAPQPSWPIGAQRAPRESAIVFTYVLERAVVLPHGDGMLAITYRTGATVIELLVDPGFILACSTIREHPKAEQRLIAQA